MLCILSAFVAGQVHVGKSCATQQHDKLVAVCLHQLSTVFKLYCQGDSMGFFKVFESGPSFDKTD